MLSICKALLLDELAFPLTELVVALFGSCYIWCQKWDNDNCQTEVASHM